ncbi:hypothetical protein TSAR_002901 [Trichomalopsis sarcophagae]|uniref:Uncharacterized protein n=1 Tax=Trichomalopsis sarcophagae TaxID=543379 RepID=A0A232EKF7_9HYME|nr:hypothetical protein TSAR_002901 [Trichomalopsis sarcophagae]
MAVEKWKFCYNEELHYILLRKTKRKGRKPKININDELTLKECYPILYDKYEKASFKCQRISRQNFIAGVTFKQLIQHPTNSFFHIAKTCAFQNREAEIYPYQWQQFGKVWRICGSHSSSRDIGGN